MFLTISSTYGVQQSGKGDQEQLLNKMMKRGEAEVWEIDFVASVVHSTLRSDKEAQAAAALQVRWLIWNWRQLAFAQSSWREPGFAVNEE